jgi:small-conductance mechanosensitive channel
MRDAEEINEERRHIFYYNQIINAERNKKKKDSKKRKSKSFGSQKIDFKDYIYVPDEWESVAYMLYVVLVPYIAGAIFLFFFIAKGNFANFKLLDTSAFFIVWLIGYEIVAAILLIWILSLYLRYEET